MSEFKIHVGDCLQTMRAMPDNSVDSIVTDPPYGLSFMGKKWDYDVPSTEIWAECLRVLKPGGHLLAFAGTRTQHRMACRIEDAGFEIRDMIAWVYGSGFPKSMSVSKAIDKAAGAERKLTRPGVVRREGHGDDWDKGDSSTRPRYDIPATDDASRWEGWGTALKPALETVTFASKPYTDEQVRSIIQSNLFRLEARLWLLSSANAAGKSSTSNPSEYGAACGIAQWSADEITSTRAVLCDQMGTSLFALATTTSLNIVSSWRRTLDESWNDGSTSTIETKSSTTIDWRTLKFSVSQITPASIIRACSLPGGFSANATTAESHFNASLSLLQSIRTLSATGRAMSQAQHEHQGAGVKPNLDPCIMARKPLGKGMTVAANVLEFGTGALNIDACRVAPTGERLGGGDESGKAAKPEGWARPWMDDPDHVAAHNSKVAANVDKASQLGRWPANLIHDGSPEVVALFPNSDSPWIGNNNSGAKGGRMFGGGQQSVNEKPEYRDAGSAARFFYCAKTSRKDRNEGLTDPGPQFKRGTTLRMVENTDTAGNTHPTVKPTDLMAYLLRLVTPPGGTALDPFMGSGSTGKAAMREGFKFIGCEIDEQYAAIARARIEHEAGLHKSRKSETDQIDLFAPA